MRASGWMWAILVGLVLLVAAGAWVVWRAGDGGPPPEVFGRTTPAGATPMAVMGDSDSHSYQDGRAFPPGGPARGGEFHARTFGWLESLARLRGSEVDPGPWLTWGSVGRISSVRRILGLPVGRVPAKEDYLYNFAYSGAACNDLMTGPFRQAPWLAALMDKEPERWRNGLVVIRMGLNDWQPMLPLHAQDPTSPETDKTIARCRDRIAEAIALLRQHQPGLKFLVVGICNEIDDPGQFENFVSAAESRNVRIALDRFNGALRDLAERTSGTAFFDQDAWFQRLWGSRDADGRPNSYKTVTVGGSFQVTNTLGDEPHNALLADHHAGVVWQALWAQSLVQRLREAFGLPLTPIGDEELWRYLQPLVAPGGVKVPGS